MSRGGSLPPQDMPSIYGGRLPGVPPGPQLAAPTAPLSGELAVPVALLIWDSQRLGAAQEAKGQALMEATKSTAKRKAGGQSKPLEEKRRHVQAVWVNSAELQQIRANAEKAGLPASVYCRRAALQEVLQAKPADAFSEAMTHFFHLAGNINQISKNLNQARLNSSLNQTIANRISDLEFFMEAISQDVNDVRLLLVQVAENK